MGHIQIRNVPPEIHRRLKMRAAEAGMSLSEYLLREVRRSAETPTMDELVQRIRGKKLYDLETDPADLIRHDRDTR